MSLRSAGVKDHMKSFYFLLTVCLYRQAGPEGREDGDGIHNHSNIRLSCSLPTLPIAEHHLVCRLRSLSQVNIIVCLGELLFK